MYTLIYFSGKELEMPNATWRSVKDIALANPNVYQIQRNNRDKEIVWERECPAL